MLAVPYLVPALVLYVGFVLYPLVDTVRLSFFSWSGFRTRPQDFVGVDNYVRLFTADPVFWRAMLNSVLWVALSLLVPMLLSLVLALALNRRMVGRNVFRSIFYMPAVFASITVAAVWRWIYNPTMGALNQLLDHVGLGGLAHEWLGDPSIAIYSIFAASIWQAVGFGLVLFLAGLQQVQQELVDSARVDGANAWHVFRNVTLPALRPTTAVVVVLTVINSLKVYDLVVGMTGGGPVQSTQVLALWSVTQSFQNHNVGMGSAVAVVLLVISLSLVVPYLVWSLRDNK
ncbi:sugar ABC transporter permease [Galbitalea sp. SE-J8]|uniref:carbohydrate ABC transporter permease n=1 Tax=Galbitalea sp. SE-J8 TaxID=3054952 RepID=UPI00259CC084|nr:sugar ABC transporter permease [Galbitalea sp. SE-J8]MDM4761552.1 sugar ABC transporter permease [Galbitalea sp. SE-J8]